MRLLSGGYSGDDASSISKQNLVTRLVVSPHLFAIFDSLCAPVLFLPSLAFSRAACTRRFSSSSMASGSCFFGRYRARTRTHMHASWNRASCESRGIFFEKGIFFAVCSCMRCHVCRRLLDSSLHWLYACVTNQTQIMIGVFIWKGVELPYPGSLMRMHSPIYLSCAACLCRSFALPESMLKFLPSSGLLGCMTALPDRHYRSCVCFDALLFYVRVFVMYLQTAVWQEK